MLETRDFFILKLWDNSIAEGVQGKYLTILESAIAVGFIHEGVLITGLLDLFSYSSQEQ